MQPQSSLFALVLLAACLSLSQAFLGTPVRPLSVSRTELGSRRQVRVFNSPEEEQVDLRELRRQMEQANTQTPRLVEEVKSTVSKISMPKVDTSEPFRFPAYGFLGLAVLLGISFTGSCVELAGGKPLLGVLPTEIIIAASGPAALGTFFLAVTRFNEEAERDNEKYLAEEARKEAGIYDDDEDDEE